MYDIHVLVDNVPGRLEVLGTVLGQNEISLEGGGVFTFADKAHAHFLVKKGDMARNVLEKTGFEVERVCISLIRKLKQSNPGKLEKIEATLAENGVNILCQYSDHVNQLILITDNDIVARQITQKWTDK